MRLFGSRRGASFLRRGHTRLPRPAVFAPAALSIAALLASGLLAGRSVAQLQASPPAPRAHAEEPAPSLEPEAAPDETPAPARVWNILLCGTDGDGIRTDAIVLAHLDAGTRRAALLSLPRDTPVRTEEGTLRKLNALYDGGGAQGMRRLMAQVRAITGILPDGYVRVDLEGFRQAVDALGGVEFDVPEDMDYDDPSQDLAIHLKKGRARLTGEQALGLVRYRSGYATQDIQRTRVQQAFLKEAARQLLRASSLPKLTRLMRTLRRHAATDLRPAELLELGRQMLACRAGGIESFTPQGEGVTVAGVSYYCLYDWSVAEIVGKAFSPEGQTADAHRLEIVTPAEAGRMQS